MWYNFKKKKRAENMSYKEGNEITIRVQCSEKDLIKILKEDNFVLQSEYYTKDIFLIPKNQ